MRTQLQNFGGDDPIWSFVAQLRTERYTGSAHVGANPRLRLFVAGGRVYFAERDGDPAVGTRLVNFGVLTATQLERGAVQVGDVVSLARLFHRDPTIDRDAVELTIEMATEKLLENVAQQPVTSVDLFPLRHHPSGIHLWARDEPQPRYEPAPAADAAPAAEPPVIVPEPEVEPAPLVAAEPVVEAPVVVAEPVVEAEPLVDAEPVADAGIEQSDAEAPAIHLAAMPVSFEPIDAAQP
ncbi:MAG: hypothetical protein KDB17_16920, partial [Ilumatobacter sp.]|nr:hypothetical protein [Ilumatobacter sp.]